MGWLNDIWNDFSGDTGANAYRDAGQTVLAGTEVAKQEIRDMNAPYRQQGLDAQEAFKPWLTDPTGAKFLQGNPMFDAAVDNADRKMLASGAAGGVSQSGGMVDQLFQNYLGMGDQFVNSGYERAFRPMSMGNQGSLVESQLQANLTTSAADALAASQLGEANAQTGGTGNLLNAAAWGVDQFGNQLLDAGKGLLGPSGQPSTPNKMATNIDGSLISGVTPGVAGATTAAAAAAPTAFAPSLAASAAPAAAGATGMAGGAVNSAFNSLLNPAASSAAQTAAPIVEGVPAYTAAGANPLMSGLATAGAGILGGMAGNAAGEAIFDDQGNNLITGAGGVAGAAIGSVVPVVGTTLGAAIGSFIGGIAGSAMGFKNNVNQSLGIATAGKANQSEDSFKTASGLTLHPVSQNMDRKGAIAYANKLGDLDAGLHEHAENAGFNVKLRNVGFGQGVDAISGSSNKLADSEHWWGSATEGDNNISEEIVATNLAKGIDRYVDSWLKAVEDQGQIPKSYGLSKLTGNTEEKLAQYERIMAEVA